MANWATEPACAASKYAIIPWFKLHAVFPSPVNWDLFTVIKPTPLTLIESVNGPPVASSLNASLAVIS